MESEGTLKLMYEMMKNVAIAWGYRLGADKRGVTALEYGLIASAIALAIIGAVSTLGTNLTTTFTNIANRVLNPTGG